MMAKPTSTHATCRAIDPETPGGVTVGCFISGTYVENVLLEEDSPPPSLGCDLLLTIHPDGVKTARAVPDFDLLDYKDRMASNHAGFTS